MQQHVTAHLRFLRMSPRKVRLVADLIRGRSVNRSVSILTLTNKRPAKPLLKLLLSAVANARHNYSLSENNLRVQSITVDGGPALKRWMPKAHGRATPVRERTSHIHIVLSGQAAEGTPKEEASVEPKAPTKKATKARAPRAKTAKKGASTSST